LLAEKDGIEILDCEKWSQGKLPLAELGLPEEAIAAEGGTRRSSNFWNTRGVREKPMESGDLEWKKAFPAPFEKV